MTHAPATTVFDVRGLTKTYHMGHVDVHALRDVTHIDDSPMPALDALRMLHLDDRCDHFPAHMSGGEQQRVAIARAIAKRPAVPAISGMADRVIRLADGRIASLETVILDVIRALELPLVLIFNKGRVMTMPQGVSKGTGLHAALETLRLSARNTLAIGDAENDHDLLRLAEVGVAVPWASPALRSAGSAADGFLSCLHLTRSSIN